MLAEFVRASHRDLPALEAGWTAAKASTPLHNASYECLDTFMAPKENGRDPFLEAWTRIFRFFRYPPESIAPSLRAAQKHDIVKNPQTLKGHGTQHSTPQRTKLYNTAVEVDRMHFGGRYADLSRRLNWPWLISSRRVVGLLAFATVAVHATVFAVFYAQLKWQILLQEVIERPYITMGMASLLILSVLALTSTRNWQTRLGSTWKRLHRWIYLAVPLALLHLVWLRKDGYEDVVIYTLWALAMGVERVLAWRKQAAIQ